MLSSAQTVAPKPALPPAAPPAAAPANPAGGPSFAQFLTEQAAAPAPTAPAEDTAAAEPAPAQAQAATRRPVQAQARPATPPPPRPAEALPADATPTEASAKAEAGDGVAAKAGDDDALDTPELQEFTQLIGLNGGPAPEAAARPEPQHRSRAAAADDAGRGTPRAGGEARADARADAAAARPGELRAADKAAPRTAAEPLQAAPAEAGAAAAPATPAPTSFAALLTQALPTPGTPAAPAEAAPAPLQAGLQAPLHSAAFAPELGARVSLLAVGGVQQAELQLNPAEMGPVAVQIVVDGSQAQVSFHAAHAETRQALEQSLPELAAALQGQGLTLSGGGVFQQAARDADQGQRDGSAASGTPGAGAGGGRIEAGANASAAPQRRSVGLLDTFA